MIQREGQLPPSVQMLTKQLPIAALLLLVPVALLAFLAVRSLSLENEALDTRRDRLASQRIDAASSLVVSRLQNVGAEILAQASAAYAVGAKPSLSAMARNQAFAYIAVFDKGVQTFSASGLEHQYYYARLFQDRAEALAASLPDRGEPVLELVAVANGYALMRCVKGVNFDAICLAAASGHVTSTLRSALSQVEASIGLTHAGLVAPNGTQIAVEGSGKVGPIVHALGGPMAGWQLRGEEPKYADAGSGRITIFYFIAAGLIAGWLAMAWLLYRSAAIREQTSLTRANIIAQLAHELRTPLANLKLHSDLLRRKSTDASAVLRYGAVFDEEIDRLTDLAENAIAVAKGAIASPKLENAVPDESVRAILRRFDPILREAGCSVSFASGAAMPVKFDRASWERGLVNLLDNARKYAASSEIRIATTQENSVLRLDVSDTGPGIPASELDLIFEPLERGAVGSGHGGFGLGLTAVRALARQNGGECWVDRTSSQRGAHLVLTMRVSPGIASTQSSTS